MAVNIVTQKGISLKLDEKWAKKGYRADRLIACEHINKPFEFTLDLTADKSDLNFKEMLGKDLSVKFEFDKKTRYFNGIVGFIQQKSTTFDTKLTTYEVRIYPQMWIMQFNRRYRIFQNKNAITIIKDLLQKNKVTKIRDDTKTRGKSKRVYCVQYEESDLHFIQRLMEEEGIFYFFEHTAEGHTLVMGDGTSAHKDFSEKGEINYKNAVPNPGFLNGVFELTYHQHVIPHTYSLQDYNFKTPKTDLKGEASSTGLGDIVREYPGQTGFEEDPAKSINKTLADLRLATDESVQEILKGMTTFPNFCAGKNITLKNHVRKDLNKKYTLLSVEHHIETEIKPEQSENFLIYKNTFQAFIATKTYRPQRIHEKRRVMGSQTATVVGPAGKEIYTDKYGRIKIQFHWDEEGKKDENSSCWVRTAQNWSDSNWGFVFIPRIGQEVIVTFLNADPDRPLIMGAVYNGDHMPPYLPDTPTKSTIKTNSVGTPKGHPPGFNELRFEDKFEEEQIYLHAEKDWDTHVVECRTTRIEKGSDTKTIERGDRSVTIIGDAKPVKGKGDDLLTITRGSRTTKLLAEGSGKGNYTIYLKRGDREITIDDGNQKITLKKGDRKVTLEHGNETVTLNNGNQSISINAGTRSIKVMKDEDHKNMANFKHNVMANYTLEVIGNVSIKATGPISMESMAQIEMKAPMISIKAAAMIEATAGAMFQAKAGAMFMGQAGAMFMCKSGGPVMAQGMPILLI